LLQPSSCVTPHTNDCFVGDAIRCSFIESTHVAKIGSDLNHMFAELLPSLAPGVHVLFHDGCSERVLMEQLDCNLRPARRKLHQRDNEL